MTVSASIPAAIMSMAILKLFKNSTIYSPYQNITVKYLTTPLNPVIIKTSHFFYQAVLNLSDNLSYLTDKILSGHIMGKNVDIVN